jgi:hypothetical protein
MELLAVSPPRSTFFDLLLIVHVGVVVICGIVLATMYAAAASLEGLEEGGAWPARARQFFATPREIAGRTLYLIAPTGFLLLWTSQGRFELSDGFVQIGLAAWLVVVLLAEGLVFPSAAVLRRQRSDPSTGSLAPRRRATCRLRWGIHSIFVLVVLGVVIMVAQP